MKKFKKTLAILLCGVVLVVSLVIPGFAEETTEGDAGILLGDMDQNGKVETSDARAILRIAAGIDAVTSNAMIYGDMNGDGAITVNDAVLAVYEATNIGGVVIPDKNGDNYLTDDPNNEFIKLISNKYNLDPESLVAIYSVPDSGTNYVLRFKGTGLLNNKPPFEKTVDNLYYVYHIGAAPKRTISYTNGKLVLGDHYNCQAAEGVMVFNLVQSMVMEQYPDYFGITE